MRRKEIITSIAPASLGTILIKVRLQGLLERAEKKEGHFWIGASVGGRAGNGGMGGRAQQGPSPERDKPGGRGRDF